MTAVAASDTVVTTIPTCPAPDPCIVETPPLCELVRCFVTDWLKTRRSRKGQGRGNVVVDVEAVGPYAWLEFDSRVPEVALRKLRNPTRYPYAEMRIADAVVNAIGEPGMFYDRRHDFGTGRDGSLRVLPNPLVSSALSRDCCGGSTSVSATSSAIISTQLVSSSSTLGSDPRPSR